VISTPNVLSSPGGMTPPLLTLGKIVAYYKYQTTKRINMLCQNASTPFWQRNYFEHIVRNDHEFRKIREYIFSNPLRWQEDQLHPTALPNRFNQK
jgi:REP element-mobilizing transposase RayT